MKKCQEWLEENHPDMYEVIWSEGASQHTSRPVQPQPPLTLVNHQLQRHLKLRPHPSPSMPRNAPPGTRRRRPPRLRQRRRNRPTY